MNYLKQKNFKPNANPRLLTIKYFKLRHLKILYLDKNIENRYIQNLSFDKVLQELLKNLQTIYQTKNFLFQQSFLSRNFLFKYKQTRNYLNFLLKQHEEFCFNFPIKVYYSLLFVEKKRIFIYYSEILKIRFLYKFLNKKTVKLFLNNEKLLFTPNQTLMKKNLLYYKNLNEIIKSFVGKIYVKPFLECNTKNYLKINLSSEKNHKNKNKKFCINKFELSLNCFTEYYLFELIKKFQSYRNDLKKKQTFKREYSIFSKQIIQRNLFFSFFSFLKILMFQNQIKESPLKKIKNSSVVVCNQFLKSKKLDFYAFKQALRFFINFYFKNSQKFSLFNLFISYNCLFEKGTHYQTLNCYNSPDSIFYNFLKNFQWKYVFSLDILKVKALNFSSGEAFNKYKYFEFFQKIGCSGLFVQLLKWNNINLKRQMRFFSFKGYQFSKISFSSIQTIHLGNTLKTQYFSKLLFLSFEESFKNELIKKTCKILFDKYIKLKTSIMLLTQQWNQLLLLFENKEIEKFLEKIQLKIKPFKNLKLIQSQQTLKNNILQKKIFLSNDRILLNFFTVMFQNQIENFIFYPCKYASTNYSFETEIFIKNFKIWYSYNWLTKTKVKNEILYYRLSTKKMNKTSNIKIFRRNQNSFFAHNFVSKNKIKIEKNNSLNQHFNILLANPTFIDILPSATKTKIYLSKLQTLIKQSATQTQEELIRKLTLKIYSWCYNQRFVLNRKSLIILDQKIFPFLWRWACRRHNNKSKRWIQTKYFYKLNKKTWIFGTYQTNSLKANLYRQRFVNFFYLPSHFQVWKYLTSKDL